MNEQRAIIAAPPLSTARSLLVGHRVAREAAAVGTATLLAGIFYWLLDAPALDPPTYLDPWYYTAFFRNFDYLYSAFGSTYYASRLPWLIPGYLLHFVFSPVAAFFVLHVVFACAGALAGYLLLRKFLGTTVALAGYAALLGNLIWWDAYSNDYPDGAVITYVLLGLAFALGSWEARRPRLRMATGGFFLAAAVGTNLFAGWLVLTLLVLYAAVVSVRPQLVRMTLLDAAAFAGGWVVLLCVCGSFSLAKGGRFLFFMPSVRQVQQQNPADVKAAGYGWLQQEPRLLLPLFVVAAVLALWSRRDRAAWRADPAVRFAAGAAASLALLSAIFAVWEFAFTGAFLEQPYYFSMLIPQIVLALAGAVHLALRRVRAADGTAVAAVALVGASLPALLVYAWHVGGSSLVAPQGLWAVGVVLGGALLVAAATRLPVAARRSAAGAVAAGVLVFGASYASATSYSTSAVFASGDTFQQREQALSLAVQLIRFVRGHGLQDGVLPPAFWFSAAADPTQIGLQSTYLWGWTQIGSAMPRLDVTKLESLHPQYLVLLCGHTGCGRAVSALAAHGYTTRALAATTLRAGDHRVVVRALELPKFRPSGPVDKYSRFYRFSGSPPVAQVVSSPAVAAWSFANGLPAGWSRLNGNLQGSRVSTSSGRFDYELQGPELTLGPGRYTVAVDGRVLVGGMLIGLLDADANSWLAQSEYWSRQPGVAGRTLGFTVSLDARKRVRLMFSNWSDGWSSTWSLSRARIVRSGG